MIPSNLLWLALLVFLIVKGFHGIRATPKLAAVTLAVVFAVAALMLGANFASNDILRFLETTIVVWLAAIGIHNVYRERRKP